MHVAHQIDPAQLKGGMPGMDHGNMSMPGMNHSKMDHGNMAEMDRSKMENGK